MLPEEVLAQGTALGHSTALRSGKIPVPGSGLAWGTGEGAAAAGPGMDRVSGGSPGPARASRAQGELQITEWAPWMETPWGELQSPGKGIQVVPSSAGRGWCPAPTHPLPHTQFRASLLQAGRFHFWLPGPLGEQAEAPAQSWPVRVCQDTQHTRVPRGTPRDALGTPALPRAPAPSPWAWE